jgi:hypothetical protein
MWGFCYYPPSPQVGARLCFHKQQTSHANVVIFTGEKVVLNVEGRLHREPYILNEVDEDKQENTYTNYRFK